MKSVQVVEVYVDEEGETEALKIVEDYDSFSQRPGTRGDRLDELIENKDVQMAMHQGTFALMEHYKEGHIQTSELIHQVAMFCIYLGAVYGKPPTQ